MATYSTSLKLTLLADGEQAGTWGQTQNTNLGTLLEQAITGVVGITMTDANYTMSNLNGVSDEARNAVLMVTGTNNAVRDVIAPLVEKLYTVYNGTTGGYAIRIKAASGSAVTIPNGMTTLVYCDGTNFYSGLSGSPGSFYINGDGTVTGNLAVTGNAAVTGNVTITGSVLGNLTATGNVTAGTNVVATTQFTGPGTGLTGTAASLTSGKATNLVGGDANKIPYQTAANTTTFLAAPTTVGTVVYWDGSNITWSAGGAPVASGCIYLNNQTITADYTMGATVNGQSAGPITIDTGVTVTIDTGANWVIN